MRTTEGWMSWKLALALFLLMTAGVILLLTGISGGLTYETCPLATHGYCTDHFEYNLLSDLLGAVLVVGGGAPLARAHFRRK